MKKIAGILSIALLALTFAGSASAQYMPNSNFSKFLSNHPNDAAELRANPSLMYNAGWQSRHPGFEEFMKNHPSDWHALNEQRGMITGGHGWFDNHNVWRNDSWWNQHHPDWVKANHPDWAAGNHEAMAEHPDAAMGHPEGEAMGHPENETVHHEAEVQHQINKAKHKHQ